MTSNVAALLKAWSIAMIGLGLLFVAAAWPVLDWPARLFLDIAFWPIDGRPEGLNPEQRLLSVIGGGLTVGWGVLLVLLFDRAHRTGDDELSRLAVTGLLAWFIVDSLGSIVVGAWMNAIINTALVAGFVIPLALENRLNQGRRARRASHPLS